MNWKVAKKISKFYSSALHIEDRRQFGPTANIVKNSVE